MSIPIGTGRFSALIDPFGAELKSLYDRREGREYIWCGDPAWWKGSAPVLFPIIGGLKDGTYRYKGNTYSLGSHGFARSSRFRVVSSTSDQLVLELNDSTDTRKIYPFAFSLQVTVSADYAGMSVGYQVHNPDGTEPLYFSIGSHPAFNLPFAEGILENYYLHFGSSETSLRHYFSNGCLTGRTGRVFANSRQIFLSRTLFDDGPVIFTDIASREVSICKSRSESRIVLQYDAPCLAVWAKPKGSPFLCIEPWHGIPDPEDFDGSLEQKPGIVRLAGGDTFTTGYSIQIVS